MGFRRLHLYTGSARGLYEKLGWSTIEVDEYGGRPVHIMAAELVDGTRTGT